MCVNANQHFNIIQMYQHYKTMFNKLSYSFVKYLLCLSWHLHLHLYLNIFIIDLVHNNKVVSNHVNSDHVSCHDV